MLSLLYIALHLHPRRVLKITIILLEHCKLILKVLFIIFRISLEFTGSNEFDPLEGLRCGDTTQQVEDPQPGSIFA